MTSTAPRFARCLGVYAVLAVAAIGAGPPEIEIWHGERQRVGHLGAAQDDFNVLGHIEPWRELDTLTWSLNRRGSVPLSFRAFRRLAEDGDFNVDVPIRPPAPSGWNGAKIR